MACALSGVVGLFSIKKTIDNDLANSWDTNSAAMHSAIHVEAQMLATQHILHGHQVEKNLQLLEESKILAHQAIERLSKSALLPPNDLRKLHDHSNDYDRCLQQVLQAYSAFQQSRTDFEEHTSQFVDFSEYVHDFGDAAVEELRDSPTKIVSWADGLETKWEIADGVMESVIEHLAQLYRLSQLTSGEIDADEYTTLNDKALREQQSAMKRMLDTGAFDKPVEGFDMPSIRKGQTYADVYSAFAEKNWQLIAQVKEKYLNLQETQEEYNHSAQTYLKLMMEQKKTANVVLQTAKQTIASRNQTVLTILCFAGGIGLILAVTFCFVSFRTIVLPIQRTVQLVKEIAQGEGDLQRRLPTERKDELGALAMWFNVFCEKLQGVVQEIAGDANNLAKQASTLNESTDSLDNNVKTTISESTSAHNSTSQMLSNIRNLADSSNSIAQNIDALAINVNEMTDTIGEISENTSDVANNIRKTTSLAEGSNAEVSQLAAAAEEIGNVIEVIEDIAEQTNLLALNATIEAARAGDSGKGFAVVATEVKQLASQTAEATEDIRERISHIQTATESTINNIGEISSMITSVNEKTRAIASAVEQQSVTSHQVAANISKTSESATSMAETAIKSVDECESINRCISSVDQVAQDTFTATENCKQSGSAVMELSKRLKEVVCQLSA